MNDNEDSQQIFKPIRRINQACNSCRRRKARCSGHRPQCRDCARLGQDCEYSSTVVGPTNRTKVTSTGKDLNNDLSTTYDTLKENISQLQAQVQSMVDCQQQILALMFSQSRERTTSDSSQDGSRSSDYTCHPISAKHPDPEASDNANNLMINALIESPMVDQFVNTYFEYCHNRPYSLFHEGNFRARLAQQELPDYLLLAIVATTLRFSGSFAWSVKPGTDIQAATSSWKRLDALYLAKNNTDIHTVQTLALLSVFDFTAGKPRRSSAWIEIGIAIRLAQDMKLMHQPPIHLPPEIQEEHRRVFWSLYLLERLASCGRGRPATINESSCQLQLPCDEKSWKDGTLRSTATLAQFSVPTSFTPAANSPFALVLLFSSLLGRATRLMFEDVDDNQTVPPWDNRSDLAGMQSHLIYLELSVSLQKPFQQLVREDFTVDGRIDQAALGPILFSQTLSHLCYCILYHPFLLKKKLKNLQGQIPNSFLSRSFEIAYDHAKQLVLQIDAAKVAGCHAHVSFNSYAAVVAGSILTLCPHNASDALLAEANSVQQTNIAYLAELGGWWNHTPTALSLLRKLTVESPKFSASIWLTSEHTKLSTNDEEFMWALLDYSAWSNMDPDDVYNLSSVAHHANNNDSGWPDLYDFCKVFPHFDWEVSHNETTTTNSLLPPSQQAFGVDHHFGLIGRAG